MSNAMSMSILVDAKAKAYDAQTSLIVDLVSSYEDYDEVIKKLIDERRMVTNEFQKRLEALSEGL